MGDSCGAVQEKDWLASNFQEEITDEAGLAEKSSESISHGVRRVVHVKLISSVDVELILKWILSQNMKSLELIELFISA